MSALGSGSRTSGGEVPRAGDHLFTLQDTMRSEGFLPRGRRFGGLSCVQDHALPLSAVSAILEVPRFRSRLRTRIAVRTAAVPTGLESMLREYAEGRHAARRAAAESGSEMDMLEAYST